MKSHITKNINKVKSYEATTMTLKNSVELDDLKQNLNIHYEKFQQHSNKIQEELDGCQEDYDEEAYICRNVEEEVYAARSILSKYS